MGRKPNFLYNTGIRGSSEVLFLTGKLCILEELLLIVFFTKWKSPFQFETRF
jgi:hypothetical protein